MENVTTIGIDLAKNTFALYGVDSTGKQVLKKKVSRSKLLVTMANFPKSLVGLEACCGSNYFARELLKLGHDVGLMAPQYVKPYVKTNKNDMADAEAICEAVARPNMRFVPLKTISGQDVQCLHRVRQRLVKNRTALCCETRGLLMEYGIVIPHGITQLRKALPIIIENKEGKLTSKMIDLCQDFYEELMYLDEKVSAYEKKIEVAFSESEDCKKISKIDGARKITATIICAAIGNGTAFKNGRQFSAWLGLVPKQYSTGGKDRLYGISKRGDKYIRSLLVHGARSVVNWADKKDKDDKRSKWVKKLKERRGFNKACVAVANKNARIIWAILFKNEEYRMAA